MKNKRNITRTSLILSAVITSLITLNWPGNCGLNRPAVNRLANHLHTDWRKGFGRDISRQNKYNHFIRKALNRWPLMDPYILKSLLIQESNLSAKRINKYGYAGIAQIGRREAKTAGISAAERLDAEKAIMACVEILKDKSLKLSQNSFRKYGTPQGEEYWKFIVAAYNAGEGTIARALRIAYGTDRPKQITFNDLVTSTTGNPKDAPLYKALSRRWNRKAKFREISEFATNILARAGQRDK